MSAEPVHLSVGMWHGALCSLGAGDAQRPATLYRERVTCHGCRVLLDTLEELGEPVKSNHHWVESYERKEDGVHVELLWRRGGKPTAARRSQARRQGHRLERVRVLDARSLKHHAERLTAGTR